MTTIIAPAGVTATSIHPGSTDHAASSGVSWGAIVAGAAAAAALSLILLVLGSGLGFAAASPWASASNTGSALGTGAIVWIIFTSIAASALGGYMAGRLRLRWTNVHADEVYFRDTAHGLLTWAVATLATAALLTSALTGLAGGVAQAGGAALKGAATAATAAGALAADGAASGAGAAPMPYYVDSLFRADTAQAADPNDGQTRSEVARIFLADIRSGSMGPADVRYLGQLVSRKTGLAPADAEKRVADSFTQASTAIANAENKARQAADEARKAAAYAALWTFVALLAGAFCASLAALSGGRRRDGSYIA